MSEKSEALPPGTLPLADFKVIVDFVRSGYTSPPVPTVLRSLLNILSFAVDAISPTDIHPLMAADASGRHPCHADQDAAVKAMEDCCEGKCPKHATATGEAGFSWQVVLPLVLELLSRLLLKQ